MPSLPPPTLCILGSINMDLVLRAPRLPAPGETILASSFTSSPGGKGANQAVAAARAGAAVRMIARTGADPHGQHMRAVLSADAVDLSAVGESPETATGLALITVASDTSQNTIVVASGANATLSPADITLAATAITSADVLLMQLETPLPSVIKAAELAKAAGVTVILNAAPAQKLPWDLLAALDVLIVNQTEAASILAAATMGADEALIAQQPVEQQLEDLERLGIPCVVITLGADGAAYSRRRHARRVPAFSVTPLDTVGAGDAFCGTFAARWAHHQINAALDDEAILDTVTWACAAGALAATKPGAIPSLPTRAEIVKLLTRH